MNTKKLCLASQASKGGGNRPFGTPKRFWGCRRHPQNFLNNTPPQKKLPLPWGCRRHPQRFWGGYLPPPKPFWGGKYSPQNRKSLTKKNFARFARIFNTNFFIKFKFPPPKNFTPGVNFGGGKQILPLPTDFRGGNYPPQVNFTPGVKILGGVIRASFYPSPPPKQITRP